MCERDTNFVGEYASSQRLTSLLLAGARKQCSARTMRRLSFDVAAYVAETKKMENATQEFTMSSMRKVDKMLLDLVHTSTNDDEHDGNLIATFEAQHAKTHGALKIKEVHDEIFLQAAKMGKTSFMKYLASSIGVIGGIRPGVLYTIVSKKYPTDVIQAAEEFAKKPTAELLSVCVGQENTDAFDFAMARYALKPNIGAFKVMLKLSNKERFDLWYKKLVPFFLGHKRIVVEETDVMYGFPRGHVLERLKMLHRDGFRIDVDDMKRVASRYVAMDHPFQDFVKMLVQKRSKERAAATRALKAGAMPLQKSIVKKSLVSKRAYRWSA